MGDIGDIHLLTLGHVRLRPNNVSGRGTPMLWWTFTSRTWTEPLPVHALVIEHSDGTLLWDTGQHPDCASPGYFPGGFIGAVYRRQVAPSVSPEHTLQAQLADIDMRLDDINLAAVSHLHYDHAGNVSALGEIPVLVSAGEHALLQATNPHLHGVLAEHMGDDLAHYRPVQFTATDDALLASFGVAHDVHGDGRLVLLPTPGHSAGSMSLLVRKAGAAPLLLVGDVTYDPDLLERGILPDVGSRSAQQDTAARIAALTEALPDLVVLATHDRQAEARLAAALGRGD